MGVKNSNSTVQEQVYNLFNAFLYYHLAERDYEKVVSTLKTLKHQLDDLYKK